MVGLGLWIEGETSIGQYLGLGALAFPRRPARLHGFGELFLSGRGDTAALLWLTHRNDWRACFGSSAGAFPLCPTAFHCQRQFAATGRSEAACAG